MRWRSGAPRRGSERDVRGRRTGSTTPSAWWCTASGGTPSSAGSRSRRCTRAASSTRTRWRPASRSGTSRSSRGRWSWRCSMPELPEVETVRRGLERALVGREIVSADIRDGRLTAPADPAAIGHELLGAVVHEVGRRGKYLTIGLDDGRTLVSHLRMAGWYHHVATPEERAHLRAVFGLDDGTWLLYSDQRRFGTMRLLRS